MVVGMGNSILHCDDDSTETAVSALAFFEPLRRHGEWADQQLLAALGAATQPVPDAVREFAHILGARETWLSRIQQRPATLTVWPDLRLEQLGPACAAVDAAWRDWFGTLKPESLDAVLSYKSLAGAPYSNTLTEVLTHVFTHAQYHRGKVNAALRATGAQPASVDHIVWTRTIPNAPRPA
jgi:uncharacterized damage-inducible protein DinB